MQYSFTCPIEGCSETLTVEAKDDDEAVTQLSEKAKGHLKEKHPDIHKTDEEIHDDIQSHMEKEEIL